MKCELCHTNEAAVHFKQVVNGVVKEMFVCASCAEANGFPAQSPTALTDFLFGVAAPNELGPSAAQKRCPACGMTGKDFEKSSRLGCAECYRTFEAELGSILESVHRGVKHTGKVPRREKASAEIQRLQAGLRDAVKAQRFEEAAELRDRIKTLQAKPGELSSNPSAS